jgi:hypothetical protein
LSESDQLSEFNRRTFATRVFEANESRLREAYAMFAAEPQRGCLLDVAAESGLAAQALAEQGWEVAAST